LAKGIDPLDAKKAERQARLTEAAALAAKTKTFKEVADQYYNFHSPSWKSAKHRAQFLSSLDTYAKVITKLPVGAIDKTLVLQVLQPIWQSKNETASRVRGRVESVLDYAKVNGWRDGDNPAAWIGNLEHALPAPGKVQTLERHPALDYNAMPAFVAALRLRQGVTIAKDKTVIRRIGVAALALEFTILTAARSGETVGARWDEIDPKAATWVVPAGRIKGGKEHRVSLSDRAIQLLEQLPRENGNPFVFIGANAGTHISNSAMAQLMKRGSLAFASTTPGRLAVPHGFRTSFKVWATEQTAYPNDLSEIALAHTVSKATEAAYRRTDMLVKRRRLMEDWARFCNTVPVVKGDKVVPIQGWRE
jgi:integrase